MAEIFKAFLIASASGTALAIILTLLKPLTKKYFSSNWHYYIYLAVLFIMIFPIKLDIPEKAVTSQSAEVINTQVQMIQETEMPSANTPLQNAEATNQAVQPILPIRPATASAVKFISNAVFLFSYIWLGGAILLLFIRLAKYIIFLLKIYRNTKIISCPETAKYTTRKVVTRISEEISSPLMIGVFKPTLLLPTIELTQEQLHNILSHEMTHLKRNDLLYKWFVSFVKCICWYNPAIYFIGRQVDTECEISCDLAVVKNMNEHQKISYIETILSLLSYSQTKAIPLTTGMTGNKKTLKMRFAMIKNKITVSKKNVVISVVAALVIIGLTLYASGILNGKFTNNYRNTIANLDVDKRNGDNFNALILGVDEEGRADAIMLFTVSDNSITGLSIPRNAEFNNKQISEILTEENGDQKVIDEIRNNFSIPITYYAKIKIDFIKDLINASGGSLVVDIPMDMKYDDPSQNLHIDLKKGEQQALDAQSICALLRYKRNNSSGGYTDGDLGRVKMGQQIAKAFVSQVDVPDLVANSKNIADSINKNVVTNYSIKNLTKDKDILSDKTVFFYTAPGQTVTAEGGFSIYKIDYDEVFSLPGINQGYELVSSLKSDEVDTSILVKYDGVLYGKSYIVIDYANTGEPIGKIDKLIKKMHIPKLNGETNTQEVLNALVYEKTDKSLVINYNKTFELFMKIR